MNVLYDSDVDVDLIRARRVAVLGYGVQGRAQALNLSDSGVDVVIGLREGSSSIERVHEDGLQYAPLAEAVGDAAVVLLLIPDEEQPSVYHEVIARMLEPGGLLVFAHGFNLHYRTIVPRGDLDVVMVAPMGIGQEVRETYNRGGGVPGLLAVQQDCTGNARQLALSLAAALGHGRAGIMETTIADETETDLFAEQAVLCGGITHLVTSAFETLVDAGYPEELAYFCCLHELKLMAGMMQRNGIAGTRESISTTAEYGDYTRGPRVINDTSKAAMRQILTEIKDGTFASELADEIASGQPQIEAGRKQAREHPIERVGQQLRRMMPWLARTS